MIIEIDSAAGTEKIRVIPHVAYTLPVPHKAKDMFYWFLYEGGREVFMTRKEMAEKFSCSASAVSRYLKLFASWGLIEDLGTTRRFKVNQQMGKLFPVKTPDRPLYKMSMQIDVDPPSHPAEEAEEEAEVQAKEEPPRYSARPSTYSSPDAAETRWKLENHKPEDRLKVLLEVHEQDWQASYPLFGKHGSPTVRELVAEAEAQIDKDITAHRSLMAVESKLYFTHLKLKEKLGLNKPS